MRTRPPTRIEALRADIARTEREELPKVQDEARAAHAAYTAAERAMKASRFARMQARGREGDCERKIARMKDELRALQRQSPY